MILFTFLLFTGAVALATWWVVRGSDETTDEGYFLAGRSLTGVFIAGSLLLTNLSTEQLIGLNASAYKEGMSVMAWEVVAGISLVALALFFLPRYLKSGIATIPSFFEERFGAGVRTLTTFLFVVAYMLILLPFVLYLGATGLNQMLGLQEMLGMSEIRVIWTVIIFIAVVGGAYAIWGGLKAVAVSDTFNGVGLLTGGLLITYLSLQYVAGEGESIFSAFKLISERDPDAFQSMGTLDEEVSWPTLFTGVLLLNFFYWSSNQQIIQRTFGAKNLAEGQKGVLLAAFFKVCAPLVLVIPGIAGAYLVATNPEFAEKVTGASGDPEAKFVYGALVASVLPDALVGFFSAVVIGSILSTFNSVLNSSATLFSIDVYKNFIRPKASTKEVVRSGQICSFVVGAFAVVAAPAIFHGKDGLFNIFQHLNSIYFIPILAIMLVGLLNKKVDGRAAMVALLVGLFAMVMGTFFNGSVPETSETVGVDGWVKDYFKSPFHYMGFVFALLVVLQLVLEKVGFSRETPYEQKDVGAVDLTTWKYAYPVGGLLIAFAVGLYVLLAIVAS